MLVLDKNRKKNTSQFFIFYLNQVTHCVHLEKDALPETQVKNTLDLIRHIHHKSVNKSNSSILTLVGNGNLEGSVLHGVWMAVSGGGHD